MQGDDLSFHNKWFHGFSTVPSHYCRSSAFTKDKKYLNPGTTILQFYKEDSTTAQESHVRVVDRKFFTELFQKLNFSVFIPRKDQCDVCVGEKHGNVSEEQYDLHIKLKDEASDEETKDKEAANDKIYVLDNGHAGGITMSEIQRQAHCTTKLDYKYITSRCTN